MTENVLTDEMAFDEQLRLERKGANAGLNPMFGEWQHRFSFRPFLMETARRSAESSAPRFRGAQNHWLFSNEIHLEITPCRRADSARNR
jgi:hypothetical protein